MEQCCLMPEGIKTLVTEHARHVRTRGMSTGRKEYGTAVRNTQYDPLTSNTQTSLDKIMIIICIIHIFTLYLTAVKCLMQIDQKALTAFLYQQLRQ